MAHYDIDSIDNRDAEKVAWFAEHVGPLLWKYFRPNVIGLERIPEGAALFVGNHSGGIIAADGFLFGVALYRWSGLRNLAHGLTHEVIINLPLVRDILMPLGAVRASHENAHKLFAAGRKVMVYPGGDTDALRSFKDRHRIYFGERRGYLRLAIREGVPIVPVVTAGAHATLLVLHDGREIAKHLPFKKWLRLNGFPIVLSIPWGLTVGIPIFHFPLPARVSIEILDPIRFDRSGEEAASDAAYIEECHEHVLGTMQTALTALAKRFNHF